jgi:hypothetical protein
MLGSRIGKIKCLLAGQEALLSLRQRVSFTPAAGLRAMRLSRTASSMITQSTRWTCRTELADSLIDEIQAATSAWVILFSGMVPQRGLM